MSLTETSHQERPLESECGLHVQPLAATASLRELDLEAAKSVTRSGAYGRFPFDNAR